MDNATGCKTCYRETERRLQHSEHCQRSQRMRYMATKRKNPPCTICYCHSQVKRTGRAPVKSTRPPWPAPRRPSRRPYPRPYRRSVTGFQVGRRQRRLSDSGRGRDVGHVSHRIIRTVVLHTIARLAPPMPRRSRKTLISCKWALCAHHFAERPCGWLDVRTNLKDSARGSVYVARPHGISWGYE